MSDARIRRIEPGALPTAGVPRVRPRRDREAEEHRDFTSELEGEVREGPREPEELPAPPSRDEGPENGIDVVA